MSNPKIFKSTHQPSFKRAVGFYSAPTAVINGGDYSNPRVGTVAGPSAVSNEKSLNYKVVDLDESYNF
jgi:hypothetical protein